MEGNVSMETNVSDQSSASGQVEPKEQPDYSSTRHRVKVYGEEREVPYEDLITGYQKGLAADEKFRKAADYMKQIEAFKSDPRKALEEAGLDPYGIAESWLSEKLKMEQMTEQERDLYQKARGYDELQKKLKEKEDIEQKYKMKEAREAAAKEIDTEISEALSTLGRKPTPRLVARIAETMLANLSAKGQRIKAKDALSRVQQDYSAEIGEYLSGLSEDEALKLLPKSLTDAIRKAQVQKVKSQDPMGTGFKTTKKSEPSKTTEKQKIGTDEWLKKIETKLGAK